MKKIGVLLLALILMNGCAQNPQPTNEEPEVSEPVEETVELVENSIYVTPTNPTNAYALAYNELSAAIEANDHQAIAESLVKCFAFDFYSLQGKTDENDVGGLTYLPDERAEEFKSYATAHYYQNITDIVNKYGETSLPLVSAVEITSTTEKTINYLGVDFSGYEISANLSYEKTMVDEQTLKTSITASVINMGGETPVYVIIAVV